MTLSLLMTGLFIGTIITPAMASDISLSSDTADRYPEEQSSGLAENPFDPIDGSAAPEEEPVHESAEVEGQVEEEVCLPCQVEPLDTSEIIESQTIVGELSEERTAATQAATTEDEANQINEQNVAIPLSELINSEGEGCDTCFEAAGHAVVYAQENNPFPQYTGEGPFPILQFINDIIVWAINIPFSLLAGWIDSGFAVPVGNFLSMLGDAAWYGFGVISDIIENNPFDAGFGYGLVFFASVLEYIATYICGGDDIGEETQSQSTTQPVNTMPASAPVSNPVNTMPASAPVSNPVNIMSAATTESTQSGSMSL